MMLFSDEKNIEKFIVKVSIVILEILKVNCVCVFCVVFNVFGSYKEMVQEELVKNKGVYVVIVKWRQESIYYLQSFGKVDKKSKVWFGFYICNV